MKTGEILVGRNTGRVLVYLGKGGRGVKIGVVRPGHRALANNRNKLGAVIDFAGTSGLKPFTGTLTDEEEALAMRLMLIGE